MVLANVDSIVAADRIDRQEGLLILYKPLVLVARTVGQDIINLSIMFHRRSCVRV